MRVPQPKRWHSYLMPCAVLAASLVLVGWLDFRPSPGRPVLAIFPPWGAPADPFLAAVLADGRVVGSGALPNSIVAQSDAPDFFSRLHHAGAWVLVDAVGRAGCASAAPRPKPAPHRAQNRRYRWKTSIRSG